MKLSPSFSSSGQSNVSVTPSEVIEYLYCPRFIYFMKCLDILQHEEKRYKVLKGREIHEERKKINRNYVRKKIGCVKKDISVYLSSERYHIRGEVDEVLFLEDGTLAPLDYKFAEYKDRFFKTHKIQSILYGLLIKDNYKCKVERGYVCYVRSNYKIKEVEFSKKEFDKAINVITEMLHVIQDGYYPKKTKYKMKCIDCCYKNICV